VTSLTETPERPPEIHEGPPNLAESNEYSDTWKNVDIVPPRRNNHRVPQHFTILASELELSG
jgi:hypothetical protein